MLLAQLHQLQLLLTGNIAERKLQGLVQAALNGFLGHGQAVVGDADVSDHPLSLGLQCGFVQAGAVTGLGAEGRVVELVDVHIVGAQIVQGGMQVLPELLRVLGGGLGGDVDLGADAVKGFAQLHLAVGVGAGGIKEADARLVSLAGQKDRILLGNALDGQGTKAVFVHGDAGAPQCDHIHREPPVFSKILSVLIIRRIAPQRKKKPLHQSVAVHSDDREGQSY